MIVSPQPSYHNRLKSLNSFSVSLLGGAEWLRQLDREAASASVMLVLIGDKWLREQDQTTGQRKLDQENDYVRREIEAALSVGSLTIPVLVEGTRLPALHSLDNVPSLAAFLRLQAMELRRKDWESDVALLKRRLEAHGLRPVSSFGQSPEFQELERKYFDHLLGWHERLTTPGARELQGLRQSLSVAYISLTVRTGRQQEPVPAELVMRDNPLLVIRGPAGSGKTTLLTWVVWSCAGGNPDSTWRGSVPFLIPLRTVPRVNDGPPRVENFIKYGVDEALWAGGPDDAKWIYDVLRVQRRGVVLLDGFDELPPGRREGFWRWLADFHEMFPKNRVVVTSRTLPGFLDPAGSQRTNDWNPPPRFLDVQLEPMTDPEVREFIRHWHDSVDTSRLDPTELASLRRARDQLPSKLEELGNRGVREICSTPLLCAMVCVLHWREEGALPGARVDLYAKCCDMLIDGRDVKRNIAPPEGPLAALTKDDKELVVQRLALDMMRNQPDSDEAADSDYRIEITRAKAIEWITPRIAGFKRLEARSSKPEDVLDYLLLRTGLLREPAANLVDFPHRSFQEYLAACAAGAEGQEQDLAKRADDDRWHRTIMFAAGTPTGGVRFGHVLIEALLARAQRFKSRRTSSQRTRKTCLALALGCLESIKQPDTELRERVLANLSEVVPPRDENGAQILAVAGDAAVPHLDYDRWKGEDIATIAACAQALRLIGSASAQSVLETGYAEDDRTPIVLEVSKMGSIPLARIPSIVRHVEETGALPSWVDVADARRLTGLKRLRQLRVSGRLPRNYGEISHMANLKGLSFVNLNPAEIRSFSWPENLTDLDIEMTSAASVAQPASDTSLSWLAEIPSLERLSVRLKQSKLNLTDLQSAVSLRNLEMHSVERDLTPLGKLTQLRELVLDTCVDEANFEFLSSLIDLQALTLQGCRGPLDWEEASLSARFYFENRSRRFELEDNSIHHMRPWGVSFSEFDLPAHHPPFYTQRVYPRPQKSYDSASLRPLTNLRKLLLQNFENLQSLEGISGHQQLESLFVIHCSRVPTLPNFAGMNALKNLQLIELVADGFDRLTAATGLHQLIISKCPRFESPRDLDALPELRTLVLDAPTFPDGLGDLKQLRSITRLVLSRCPSVTDLSFIEGMASLRHLVLADLPLVRDLDTLKSIAGLKQLTLIDMDGLESLGPLEGCGGLKRVELSDAVRERLAATAPPNTVFYSIAPDVKAGALISSGMWWRLVGAASEADDELATWP
jgi:hypothetical protein